jgi:hypothetical protein
LKIEDSIPCRYKYNRKIKSHILFLCDSIKDSGNNGKDKKDKSGDREEIKPKTKIVIFKRGKKAIEIHIVYLNISFVCQKE